MLGFDSMPLYVRTLLFTGPADEVQAASAKHREHLRALHAQGKLRMAGEHYTKQSGPGSRWRKDEYSAGVFFGRFGSIVLDLDQRDCLLKTCYIGVR